MYQARGIRRARGRRGPAVPGAAAAPEPSAASPEEPDARVRAGGAPRSSPPIVTPDQPATSSTNPKNIATNPNAINIHAVPTELTSREDWPGAAGS